MQFTPRSPAPELAADASATADEMHVEVGNRFIPWAEFWALMDEQADAVTHAAPAPSTTGGPQ